MRVVASASAPEIAALRQCAGLPLFRVADLESQRPDLHLSALSDAGEVQARCSLWWRETPLYEQHRVGAIGHYAAQNDSAAAAVLAAATKHMRETRCTLAVGPMNGNTWRSYRFVTEAGNEPPFFLEPVNPPEWPAQFMAAGFTPLALYFSALNSNLTASADPRMAGVEKRIAVAGVSIRQAKPELRSELTRIYAVSRVAFRKNFLYTEAPWDDVSAMYEPLLPMARPELVFISERNGECVGYLFAIPDLAQQARGAEVDTFIIKTVAILPEPQLKGLGSLLVARAQQQGHRLGYRRCIHALMHENNSSMNISRHYASPMRRYTLYAKELAK